MARGDHVEVARYGFHHHGIDLGDGSVVHFTGEPMHKLKAQVQRTDWAEFARGYPFWVVDYEDASTWTPDHTCLRALKLLGATGYDLVRNNCEHFAMFCKTGQKRSLQIEQSISRIVRYSRFGVFNPGYFLLGPAYELTRRTVMATTRAVGQALGTESTPSNPSVPPVAPVSFFHYVDLYAAAGQGEVFGYAVTPYGQWYELSPQSQLCQQSPQAAPDTSAIFKGRLLADDNLMLYWLRTDGTLVRQAPGDDEIRYTAAEYTYHDTHYLLTQTGECLLWDGDSWQHGPSSLPADSVPLAMLFLDSNGLEHALMRTGWFTLGADGPVAEPPFMAKLALI